MAHLRLNRLGDRLLIYEVIQRILDIMIVDVQDKSWFIKQPATKILSYILRKVGIEIGNIQSEMYRLRETTEKDTTKFFTNPDPEGL